MSVTEKAAYLKGLAEGLEITPDTKEGKLLLAVLDLLDDMALSIADLEDETAQIGEQVDMIDEDLSDLEDDYYDLDSDGEDDEDGCGCGCQDESLYEIVCPKCGDSIYVDEGSMHCPNCDELLEFDLEGLEEDEEEEDGCGCGCGCQEK